MQHIPLQLKDSNDNGCSCGYLSLENFNNFEEQVVEIYTNLISIMRRTIDDEADKEQNTTEKNEKIKIQGFAKSFASNTATNNNSKKLISYRSYIDK